MNFDRSQFDFSVRRLARTLVPVVLLVFGLTIYGGCGLLDGGGDESQSQAKKPLAPEPAAAKTAAPEQEESRLTLEKLIKMQEAKLKAYVFSPKGMLDPFRPIEAIAITGKSDAPKEPVKPLTPLQKMELSQLKLVAIVLADQNTRALVEDASGLGYILEIGTLIGRRDGQVVAIHSDGVDVEETYKDYLGNVKTRVSTMKLRKREGEGK